MGLTGQEVANYITKTGADTISGIKTFLTGTLKAPDITSTGDFIVNVGETNTFRLVKANNKYDTEHYSFYFAPATGVSAPDIVSVPGTSDKLKKYGFAGIATTEALHTLNGFGFKHGIVEGQDFIFYITVGGDASDVDPVGDPKTIKFYFDYSFSNLPVGKLSVPVTLSATINNPGLDPEDGTPIFKDMIFVIPGSAFTIGTTISGAIRRVPADDTFGGDAIFGAANGHFDVHQLGSSEELTP